MASGHGSGPINADVWPINVRINWSRVPTHDPCLPVLRLACCLIVYIMKALLASLAVALSDELHVSWSQLLLVSDNNYLVLFFQ